MTSIFEFPNIMLCNFCIRRIKKSIGCMHAVGRSREIGYQVSQETPSLKENGKFRMVRNITEKDKPILVIREESEML